MYRIHRTILAVLALAVFVAPAAGHAQMPEVLFATPEEQTLTVVEHLSMVVRPYQPSYVLEPSKPGAASDKTPESALAGWLGAIVARDREALANSFDEASRPSSTADPAAEERFFEYLFRGRRIELLHRLEVDGRLLIELASFDSDSGEQVFKTLIHMREVEGGWRLADLPATQVFARLVADFDPEADRLAVDLGYVLRTSRP